MAKLQEREQIVEELCPMGKSSVARLSSYHRRRYGFLLRIAVVRTEPAAQVASNCRSSLPHLHLIVGGACYAYGDVGVTRLTLDCWRL